MKKSSFQDEHTLWHDKKKGSNNPGIYTAIAQVLIPNSLDRTKINAYFYECAKMVNGWKSLRVDRKPNMIYPPFSMDEWFGWDSLGNYTYNMLEKKYFTFSNLPDFVPRPLYKVNYLRLLFKEVPRYLKLGKGDKNLLWEDVYFKELRQLAFRVMFGKKYYVKKKHGKRANILEYIFWQLDNLIVYLNNDVESKQSLSTKNIKWLELIALNKQNTRLYKKLRREKAIERYFGPDHDFTEAVQRYDKAL